MPPTQSPSLTPALVTDGLWRKSMSVVRSLGQMSIPVAVQGDSWLTPSFWSSQTQERLKTAAPETSPSEWLADIKRWARRPERIKPVLFPMEDTTLSLVSDHRESLSKVFSFLVPDPRSLELAQSKEKTQEAAHAINIPVPLTLKPSGPEELTEMIKTKRLESWIIKPVSGSGSLGILYELPKDRRRLERHWVQHGPLLLQQRIPLQGDAWGVSFLFDESSNMMARFTHRRIYQYPVSGGPSTQRTSASYPEIEAMSEKLLKSLEWKGVAMVEWKVDPKENKPYLLEINPRFWGSLELAVRAGVDFPRLYYDLCTGKKPDPVIGGKPNILCRWLIPGDILRWLSSPLKKRETLRLFFKGLPQEAEEWNDRDKRGMVATVIGLGISILHPKFWKFLRRR